MRPSPTSGAATCTAWLGALVIQGCGQCADVEPLSLRVGPYNVVDVHGGPGELPEEIQLTSVELLANGELVIEHLSLGNDEPVGTVKLTLDFGATEIEASPIRTTWEVPDAPKVCQHQREFDVVGVEASRDSDAEFAEEFWSGLFAVCADPKGFELGGCAESTESLFVRFEPE